MNNDAAIKTIREALEEVATFLVSDYGLDGSAADYYGTAISERAAPVFDKVVNAQMALDALAVEPSEDVIQIVRKIRETDPDFAVDYVSLLSEPEAAALIERHVAAREAKAREEERGACAERAKRYIKQSYNHALGVQIIVPEELVAAIKEAGE